MERRIALVCAARTGAGDDVLAGLPELSICGLGDSDARALLLANVPGPLDAAVYLGLATAGGWVLYRRQTSLSEIIRNNQWESRVVLPVKQSSVLF